MKKMTKNELRLVLGGSETEPTLQFCSTYPGAACYYSDNGNLIGANPPQCIIWCFN